MANVAIYDPNKTPNPIIQYLESVNTPDYSNRSDALINPDLSEVAGIPVKYWKHSSGLVKPMTQQERDDVDAEIDLAIANEAKVVGKSILDGSNGDAVLLKAFSDIVKDEINILRQWISGFKSEVSSATSLSDLKSRVAGLPDLNDRTFSQFITAIKNRIDSGIN